MLEMKANIYTQFVLTVIAICLTVIVVRDINILPEAFAATDRGENVVKVQIVSVDESPNLGWESLPVTIEDY